MTISKRNITVDIARIIAAFGVVSIHVSGSTKASVGVSDIFSSLCVPFFYVVSLNYFVSGLKKDEPVKEVLKKSWRRIIVPYLAWTLVYFFLMVVKSKLVGLQPGYHYNFWMIFFYGCSAVQLYFLPQLIALQSMAFGLYLIAVCDNKKKITGALALLLAILYISIGHIFNVFGTNPTANIIFYLICAFFFLSNPNMQDARYAYTFIGLVLIFFSEFHIFSQINNSYLNYISRLPIGGLGVSLIVFALPKHNISSKILLIIYSTSFGVYLSHVVFLEGFEFIFKKIYLNFSYDLINKMLVVSLIFICSVFFTLVVRQNRLTKKIFLGE